MKLLFLIGDPTSENMPVGQALAGISGFRLFHSQMMLSPVRELFGGENIQAVRRLCDVVFEECALSDQYGLIFILNRKPEQKDVWDSIEHIQKILAPYSVQFYCVDLAMRRQAQVLSAAQNLRRQKTVRQRLRLRRRRTPGPGLEKPRRCDRENVFSDRNYLCIHDCEAAPKAVAEQIKSYFSF